MKLEMRGQMRMEQKMKLAPHMIQSMEILQLPILALQERIEQELNSNPVLEIEQPASPDEVESAPQDQPAEDIGDKDLVLSTDNNKVEDFERLDSLGESFTDYMAQAAPLRTRIHTEELDKKLEALKNTAAPPQSLHEYLADQWRLVEAAESVKKAVEPEASRGCFLQEYSFRPTFQKWKGEICNGFMLHIIDPHIYRPYFTSFALLKAVIEIHGNDFEWKKPPYEYEQEKRPIDLIIGDTSLLKDLESGATLSQITQAWASDLESFSQWRNPYLMY